MRPYDAHPFYDLRISLSSMDHFLPTLILRISVSSALYAFFYLLFSLFNNFLASSFFARSRTISFFPSFLFYCLPCFFVSCNHLRQLFICRRTLSLTFYLFQRIACNPLM